YRQRGVGREDRQRVPVVVAPLADPAAQDAIRGDRPRERQVVVGLAIAGAGEAIEPGEFHPVLGLARLRGDQFQPVVARRKQPFENQRLTAAVAPRLANALAVPVEQRADLAVGGRADAQPDVIVAGQVETVVVAIGKVRKQAGARLADPYRLHPGGVVVRLDLVVLVGRSERPGEQRVVAVGTAAYRDVVGAG